MQQLSAEAEKALPADGWEEGNGSGAQFAQILQEFSALNGRLQSLEETVAKPARKAARTASKPISRSNSAKWTSIWSRSAIRRASISDSSIRCTRS